MIWIFVTLMVIILGLILLVIYLLDILQRITYGTIEVGRKIVTPNNRRAREKFYYMSYRNTPKNKD